MMIPNYIDDTQAAKGNMAVRSEHFPQNCRFNDKEGIYRRKHPLIPFLSFILKKRRVSGHQLLSLDLQQRQLHLSGVMMLTLTRTMSGKS